MPLVRAHSGKLPPVREAFPLPSRAREADCGQGYILAGPRPVVAIAHGSNRHGHAARSVACSLSPAEAQAPTLREPQLTLALVTGCAGFIGSHLTESLLGDGDA